MEGTSLSPIQENLKTLQTFLPKAIVKGKINWEKLKATHSDDVNFANECIEFKTV